MWKPLVESDSDTVDAAAAPVVDTVADKIAVLKRKVRFLLPPKTPKTKAPETESESESEESESESESETKEPKTSETKEPKTSEIKEPKTSEIKEPKTSETKEPKTPETETSEPKKKGPGTANYHRKSIVPRFVYKAVNFDPLHY
jgi:hypothetical protein